MLRELNGSMGGRPASLAQTQSVVNGGELAEDDSEEVTFDVKVETGLPGGRSYVCVCVCVWVSTCMYICVCQE